MGINDSSFQTLEWLFQHYSIKTLFELGSQNFYQTYGTIEYGCYADKYYRAKGVETYVCVDINGENNAIVWDLSKPQPMHQTFDLVTDFGTCEHIAPYDVKALYNCWMLKFEASHSLILSSNPAKGHWKGHGYYYFTPEFYQVLASLTNMQIVKLHEPFAMGNTIDGKETQCLLQKTSASHWITLDEFKQAFQHVFTS
jgi:hypothetical protein